MRTISLVVACYLDALAIPVLYRRVQKVFNGLPFTFELIYVVDGSPDNSESVVRKLAARDRRVKGVFHSRNFSSQQAFTSGMQVATGDALVLLDGDLQDPPEMIPALIARWQAGYDVVYGVRVRRRGVGSLNWAYQLFYRVFQKLSYVKVPLDAGDFSLLDRRVVQELNAFPERDRFIRGLRAWVGFRQIGVPYVRPARLFGNSTNNWGKNIRWAIKGIFSFSYVPLQAMTAISFGVFLLAVLGMVIQIILRLLYPDTPHGITTVLVVVLFMGAVQLLGISILGEYLAKIFEEVKQRPKFIVKEQVGFKSTQSAAKKNL